jgi:REP element-mobilizing transposase RayT
MDQSAYHLDRLRRDAVLRAIQEVCAYRGWNLLAAHVRSNHVHTVVEAEDPPERVMGDFKAYASWMNRSGSGGHDTAAHDGCGDRSMSRRRCST